MTLEPDSGGSEVTLFEIGSPGKQVHPRDNAHFFRFRDVEKSGQFLHIVTVGPSGLFTPDIGIPFEFLRHGLQSMKLQYLGDVIHIIQLASLFE